MYKFHRIQEKQDPANKGSYSHPCFQREKLELCKLMVRESTNKEVNSAGLRGHSSSRRNCETRVQDGGGTGVVMSDGPLTQEGVLSSHFSGGNVMASAARFPRGDPSAMIRVDGGGSFLPANNMISRSEVVENQPRKNFAQHEQAAKTTLHPRHYKNYTTPHPSMAKIPPDIVVEIISTFCKEGGEERDDAK